MFRAVATVALIVVASGLATASDYNEFRVGAWEGRAHRSDRTGEFTHCAISARYPDGTIFTLGISRDNFFTVFFGDEAWHLAEEARYPVELYMDGESIGKYTAFATGDVTLRIAFGTDRILFGALRLDARLTIKTALRDFSFPLTGTSRALTRLQDCVDGERATAGAGGGNPFVRDDPARNPFKAGPVQAPRGYTRKEVAHILSKTGIRDPEFLSEAEMKQYSGFGHMWTMNGMMGFVSQFLRNPNASVDEQTARFMARLTNECRGESGSSAKPARTQGMFVFKESFVSCAGGEDFYAYAVAMFEPSRVSVFGYIGWGAEGRAMAEAATAKLAGVLQQMFF
jgi:hypothetical protein